MPAGVVTFTPGEASQTIAVSIAGDTAFESDESFVVTLSTPSAGLAVETATAAGLIVNDDAIVSLAAVSASQDEGHAGAPVFVFALTSLGDSTVSHSVSYAVSGSGANPARAADFAGGVLPAGVVTFAAGETSSMLSLGLADDSLVEADESFSVTLSSPSSGLALAMASAAATILNDDALVSTAALSADRVEGHTGSTAFTFELMRSGDVSVSHSVVYSVSGTGTNFASAGDFTGGVLPLAGVTFASGETIVVVDVMGDFAAERDESFAISLSAPSAGLLVGAATAGGMIRNDDMDALDDAYVGLRGQSLQGGCRADLSVRLSPESLTASLTGELIVEVRNVADGDWRVPLFLGNHWRDLDGKVVTFDDARSPVPSLAHGDSAEISLTVVAPTRAGTYQLEVDVVQEGVRWFAAEGSATSSVRISVEAGAREEFGIHLPQAIAANIDPVYIGAPAFEMHGVPPRRVEEIASASGMHCCARNVGRNGCPAVTTSKGQGLRDGSSRSDAQTGTSASTIARCTSRRSRPG